MGASALAAEIRALGCRLAMDGAGRLEVAPGSALTDALRAQVRAEREALLDLLRLEADGSRPLAPAAPRPLPEPPRPGGGPTVIEADALAPVPGSPHAELEADWRAALALARQRFAAHGGAPGGRDAHKFIRDAATLECLLLSREREFEAWRDRWRACLEGVYAGAVALLPSFERDLLVAYRSTGERVRCQRCGAAFERPADLPSHVPAQFCGRCTEGLQ